MAETKAWRTKPRPVAPDQEIPGRWGGILRAVPARPTIPPQPRGDLTQATPEEIAAVSQSTWDDWRTREYRREAAIKRLLHHLEQFPGETWQQRWESSGLDLPGQLVRDLERPEDRGRSTITGGLEALLCLRVIRPSLPAMRSNKFLSYAKTFRVAQDDPLLDRFFKQTEAAEVSHLYRNRALLDVCCALTTQGIVLADLTPEAFLHYAKECRELAGVVNTSTTRFTGHLAWEVLHEMEHFPPQTPRTLRTALRAGRLSVEQLVRRYPVANPQIAQLFIDYLSRRQPGLDYSSIEGLSRELVNTFWCTVEKINPDQADLRLSEETYQQWRAELKFKPDGSPRLSQDSALMAVRAFYYDLQAWAAEEPGQWARWVAPCPIRDPETRGKAARRRRSSERVADRTRRRQPLLPALVAHIEDKYARFAELLAAGDAAAPGEIVTVDGRAYQRVFTDYDRRRQTEFGQAHVRVRDQETGELVNVSRKEQKAFWEWAIVETLRHSGVRVEELLKLTQLSVRQYQRPNGEVVALLVIAPSKTDRERVIPMSAELFHVIAAIIRRHTRDRPTISLVTRFDPHDKQTSSPQPFLFQRVVGSRREAFSSTTVVHILGQLCADLAEQRREFAEAKFTPHDFRRLLATDLVNSGLPIHIGAALLGHLDLGTTRGYVAVFEEDLVRHYQAHLARRRKLRPTTSIGRPTRVNGESSRNTSTDARPSSATAAAPTEPLARTSTLVCDVPSCRSVPRCCPASTSSRPT
ncbi:site-specific integrase [Nonomuraea rosea]|uniref:Site-specific integrase n=1 Tax=Nonomuraea rosea TaxID=638574 RepID=A0ABP6ZRU0_9ACTN